MRVFIITQDEPVYAPTYLSKIIAKSRHPVVGVTALSPAGKQGWLRLAKSRLEMYGPRDFLRAVSLYGRSRLRGRWPWRQSDERFGSVKDLGAAYSIPLYACANVNDPEYTHALQSLSVDLVVSVAANQRFGPQLLQSPRLGCLNVHSALLPKYRGMDALFATPTAARMLAGGRGRWRTVRAIQYAAMM
jgi:methionyl-tRNA formyltransferase